MEHDELMERDERFALWYSDHHDRIRAMCARMLRDPAAGEDLAQETLLRAWTRRDSIREADVGAWLSVVARNLCISYLRRHGRVVPTDSVPDIADVGADPLATVERLESRRAVRRAMREVGERHRVLLFRREVEGVDYEELGAEIGLTPGGTRAVLFRARQALRERLVAVGEGFSAVLLGVRVRIRGAAFRARTSPAATDGGVVWQAGMNLALALTVSLATFGAASATAPRQSPSIVAVVAPRQGGLQGLARRDAAAIGAPGVSSVEEGAPANSGAIAQNLKPRITPHAYDPEDGSGTYEINFANQTITIEKWRQPNDHFDAQYKLEDWLFPRLCPRVDVCESN